VSRSVTRLTRSTFPYGSKSVRREDSVTPKSKFPTKMFFIFLTLVLQSGGETRLILIRPGCCGTSKVHLSPHIRTAQPHTYSFFSSDVFVLTHTGQQVSQYQPRFFVGMCRTVGRRPHFLHVPCTEDDWMQGFTALASRLLPDPQSRRTLDVLDKKHYVPLPAAFALSSDSARNQSSSGEPSGHPRACQYE
jgi:hypothetical protein